MTWRQASYDVVRESVQLGDVIAFGGRDCLSGWVTAAIKSPVSHVALVLQACQAAGDASSLATPPQIIESVGKPGSRYGVRIRCLDERVTECDDDLWWLPLADAVRARLDEGRFCAFLRAQERKPYDPVQAVQSAKDRLDHVPVLGALTHALEDFSAFFCSELVAAGLEAGGAIHSLNCSEVTPLDVVQFAIYDDTYYQLRGDKTLLEGYNTLDPEGWGE